MLTQAILKELLHYDPETGIFTWLNPLGNRVSFGEIAGCLNDKGYRCIRIDTKAYKASRLAFLYMEGYFPEYTVDHKDRVNDNNRWGNLRHASMMCNSQNCKIKTNNKTGFNGVHKNKNGAFLAQICIKGKTTYLGSFGDPISAALVRSEYEKCHPDWKCNYKSENFTKLRAMGYAI